MTTLKTFIMALVAMSLIACGRVDFEPRDKDPVATENQSLRDADNDGVPDLVEGTVCGEIGIIKDVVHPAHFTEDGEFIPAAVEACDGLDNDCDGLTDEDPTTNIVADNDMDRAADCFDQDDDNDGVPDEGDCAPMNENVRPGIPEVCGDQADTNCNGMADQNETGARGCVNFWIDRDGDTFGVGEARCLCQALNDPPFRARQDGDCNDDRANMRPGLPELCDGVDNNCDGQIDDQFIDSDNDDVADCQDPDDDNDGVPDAIDNCDLASNADQLDTDQDADGNICDADDDGDGVLDAAPDNCRLVPNTDQLDTDRDTQGDACDTDDDGDSIPDATDNCPLVPNPDQRDTDGEDGGNACDTDDDNDGVSDPVDNCMEVSNPNQRNTDNDTQGDACDTDDDGDSIPDATDNCPLVPNPDQRDTDGDDVGDACEDDTDGDGDPNASDCADLDAQVHTGAPEICDGEDNDCDTSTDEGFPNTDGDGLADCADEDDDNDGFPDDEDCMPLDSTVHPNVLFDECNGRDDDCDGRTDENPSTATGRQFYNDPDQDGYGRTGDTVILCNGVAPYTATRGGDCLEGNAQVNPGAAEVCGNGVDENCSGGDQSCVGTQCSATAPCPSGFVCQAGTCVAQTAEVCNNGNDDDGDGRVDCGDTDCQSNALCQPACTTNVNCPSGQVCQNGTCVAAPAEVCTDQVDNDRDGSVDCADPDCRTAQVCQQGSCTSDADCTATRRCVNNACVPRVEDCSTTADEDGDGISACDDPDCTAWPGCSECDQSRPCPQGMVCSEAGRCEPGPQRNTLRGTIAIRDVVPEDVTALHAVGYCEDDQNQVVLQFDLARPLAQAPRTATSLTFSVPLPANLAWCKFNVRGVRPDNHPQGDWWLVRGRPIHVGGYFVYSFNDVSVSCADPQTCNPVGAASNGLGGGDFVFFLPNDPDGDGVTGTTDRFPNDSSRS